MEPATKRSTVVMKTNLRALVNGQYAGDPRALINRLAADLLAGVSEGLQKHRPNVDGRVFVSKPVRQVVEAQLGALLIRDSAESTPVRHKTLPVTTLRPDEVIALTGMSKTTLYRADHTKFYSVVPPGMQNNRAYPAWQFVGDVHSQLPRVLAILNRKSRIQVNTFFVSERDALNELSAAEVLAGLPFEDRGAIMPEQYRTLSLPEKVRLDKVLALATMEVVDQD